MESSAVSPLGLSSLTKKLSSDICFYTFWLGSACGLIKTVTETSVQFGKEARMEVVVNKMGRPHMN